MMQLELVMILRISRDLGPRDGRGRIVNVASMLAVVAPCNRMAHTAYTTSKHGTDPERLQLETQCFSRLTLVGVIGLTKADANSYGSMGIRINAICPGYVETPLLRNTMAQDPNSPLAADLARTPLKRLATMEEVGDSIVLMASPMNSFMQGASIVCDGGFTTN